MSLTLFCSSASRFISKSAFFITPSFKLSRCFAQTANQYSSKLSKNSRSIDNKKLQASKFSIMEYQLENDTPMIFLDCKTAFDGLTKGEKKYVHHLNVASWTGGLICLIQTSPESPALFLLMQHIFRKQSPEQFEQLAKDQGLSEEEIKAVMVYFCGIYGNLGNYKSFGDSKFVPNLDKDKFFALIESTEAVKTESAVSSIWEDVRDSVYSLHKRVQNIGLGEDGLTTYFSSNCTEKDAAYIQKFLDQANISPYNTRLMKSEDDNNKITYTVRQASCLCGSEAGDQMNYSTNGMTAKVIVEKGDYCELMKLMVSQLQTVSSCALNDTERLMFKHYIASFTNGSIDEHKTASRYWIKDKGPVVENYIGFIESYRDPSGVRGEFESFIAVVNKEKSVKFNVLVDGAPELLSSLPWGAHYEKDKFLQPDFTSLDIVNFATGGIPIGINIPNYDDIRQSEGFKNVSLGNVLSSRFKDPKVSFLCDEDKALFLKHVAEAFEIQVGLHELIGHGSGKLFRKEADGTFNFDKDEVVSIIDGGSIKHWYEHGETWDGKFTNLASPYEECRAECVGIYLCTLPNVLQIFGHKDAAEGADVAYINWLTMARSGLVSLEMFTPETKAWRQAHSQARFVILQVLMEAGEDLVTVEELTGADGKPDICVRMDRSKLDSVARPAIGDFLKKLQFYKSTGNVSEGKEMFLKYSTVSEHFLHIRQIVLDRKQARPLIIQCTTSINSDTGDVEIKEYPATTTGMLQSFQDRFQSLPEAEKALEAVWRRDFDKFDYKPVVLEEAS